MLGFGIKSWVDKQFKSRREAEDYICDHQEKWKQAIAVSYLQEPPPIGRNSTFPVGSKVWIIGGWCAS
jgi:hypothetical protein